MTRCTPFTAAEPQWRHTFDHTRSGMERQVLLSVCVCSYRRVSGFSLWFTLPGLSSRSSPS